MLIWFGDPNLTREEGKPEALAERLGKRIYLAPRASLPVRRPAAYAERKRDAGIH
jgi:hypothetical protein